MTKKDKQTKLNQKVHSEMWEALNQIQGLDNLSEVLLNLLLDIMKCAGYRCTDPAKRVMGQIMFMQEIANKVCETLVEEKMDNTDQIN